MAQITRVHAREVLDSRGNPTVEVEVTAGALGRAIVPSGASTGAHEAVELRDGGKRFKGLGVLKAVKNVNQTIAPAIMGMEPDQAAVDVALLELDPTPQKANLGANALLGVSMATAHAAAAAAGVGLWQHIASLGGTEGRRVPVPLMNILNGGAHADTNVSIQEFMVAPVGASSFPEALRMGAEVYHALKATLRDAGLATAVGDEGGFAPNLPSNMTALEMIEKATARAGYDLGVDLQLALDVAATELWNDKATYDFGQDGTKDAAQATAFYEQMLDRFPVASIEDGFAEDDHDGWRMSTAALGNRCQLVGDDVFVTNPVRLRTGIETGEANSILIKLNQIGTLSETLDVMRMARDAGYSNVVSHRSGETEDTTIAHLAVGTDAGQIKTGAPARSDRVAKYNELLRINEALGGEATWANPFG